MNTVSSQQAKRILPLLWVSMLAAIAIYIALTYFATATRAPFDAGVYNAFLLAAGLAFFVGVALERGRLAGAALPTDVVQAGLISGAFGEIPAVLGLAAYFIGGERLWALFALSGLYYLRLFLRLPGFFEQIDGLGKKR